MKNTLILLIKINIVQMKQSKLWLSAPGCRGKEKCEVSNLDWQKLMKSYKISFTQHDNTLILIVCSGEAVNQQTGVVHLSCILSREEKVLIISIKAWIDKLL